jgi:cyclic beta-1,2-glucan synthetase
MRSYLNHVVGVDRDSAFAFNEIIRAEIFSAERLEQHAETLAEAQRVAKRPVRVRALFARLGDNHEALLRAHRTIAKSIAAGGAITPAAEWLVDNYHVVEAQIRQVRDDMPPGYYRELPKLESGPLTGYPRVLGLAWAFVAHTDSRFDAVLLQRFVAAYQRVQPLTIGELWAIAITLRVVLIENLRRAAELIGSRRAERQLADRVADRLLGAAGQEAETLAVVLPELERIPFSTTFAVQLLQRLRDQDPEAATALTWLDDRLADAGTTAEEIVRDEHQRQGASSVTVRNVIMSMRSISAVAWTELVESMSLVDAILCVDPFHAQSTFSTRNRCRHAIEELARGSRCSELAVAEEATRVAEQGETQRARLPGYHLIAGGRRAFEARLGFRPTVRARLTRLIARMGIRGYIAGVALLACVMLAWPMSVLLNAGVGGLMLATLAILGAVLTADAAMAVANQSISSRFGARPLPELELAGGIPTELRTIVVVPVLLTSCESIAEYVEHLEIHHLASIDGDVTFALLSDWVDAPSEQVAGDDELLAIAVEGIARLNQKYGTTAHGDRFLLLHRRRLWNPTQGAWMGWERKRGKLHELNRLLRGALDTSFMTHDGRPPAVPTDVRYVVTLDADTRLPRDTVRRLVGKMAHPLNAPCFDPQHAQVVDGYAILQPRIASALPLGYEGSRYQRLLSGAGGIDPYASAVSDVYQDLCGEGSYVGKGIYDVDAFEAALAGRVPENAMLSHDLFEGVFARAGLASDIELVDEYPARYAAASARSHRWVRGDWQLLPWVFGCGPIGSDHTRRGIPLLGRWKMFDNLRRSLLAPAALSSLVLAWTLPLPLAFLWTAFVVVMLALPTLPSLLAGLVPRHKGIVLRSHLLAIAADARLAVSRTALALVLLPHQAWLMCDAIGRTLFRLFVTHHKLLEWVTAQEQNSRRLNLAGHYRLMVSAIGVSMLVLALVALGYVHALLAIPFVLAWQFSPPLACWISQPSRVAESQPVSDVDARALRLVARRAWQYFDRFVTAADNMLPPDNFQEDPWPVLAHRTSPTNIGLYLLAVITARDFGWIGTADAVERLEQTLATMDRLETCHGHLYNWYDTQDLRPLDPRYVSSVDSGNLAAHLLTLANACEAMIGESSVSARVFAGIGDSVLLASDFLGAGADPRLATAISEFGNGLASLVELPAPPESGLDALAVTAAAMVALTGQLAVEGGEAGSMTSAAWVRAAQQAVESHRRDSLADLKSTGAAHVAQRLRTLAATARRLAEAMRFDFLFDQERRLLAIGYRVPEGMLDSNCYDLLASEARLASFVAVANGDIPARHWFHLGRAVVRVRHGAALVSWSGSMFEYLMPSLVMRAPAGSLLEQTSHLVVRRQQAYARRLGVPWGISESAYNARDLERTYQYSSFGVPGLGLKRGLGDNVVIAPYATALAAMVKPLAAVRNFARLERIGAHGRYGFYESLDYTAKRLPEGEPFAIVRAYMAHHQGMTIVALANTLLDGVMRKRFHAEPRIKATELLLQERTPREVSAPVASILSGGVAEWDDEVMPVLPRRILTPHHATPRTRLLSNGRYSVLLTAAGSGYSQWRDLAVTRWSPDVTCDALGSYHYLRDVGTGDVWSAGYQPTGIEPDGFEATFSEHRAEFMRRDGGLTTTLDVVVSTECDAEVRRITLANMGDRVRTIEVTSYAELVLAPRTADEAHPAFSKLFVQTEYLPEIGVLLAARRRRSPQEAAIWAAHLVVVEGATVGTGRFETDRAAFLGRGRHVRAPAGLSGSTPAAGAVGTVLDPIFSLTRCVRLAPGATARIAFWTLVAETREEVLDLVDQHRNAPAFDRAAMLAWTQGQVELHHLGIAQDEAALYQRLAGHLLYSDPALRSSADVLRRPNGGQQALWAHGISGDLPIVLVRIDDADDLGIVRQLLRAFEYWRLKRFNVDLVILNERASSYVQDLQSALEAMTRTGLARAKTHDATTRGGVFVLRSDIIPGATRLALLIAAGAVLLSRHGSLAEQLDRLEQGSTAAARRQGSPRSRPETTEVSRPTLEFFNGLGGFTPDGEEYVTVLKDGQRTPAPWINVVANAGFGFQVSAEGGGCTWAGNSRENRITPWSNDPVTDRSGEALYVRDDETGLLFGPTLQPAGDGSGEYLARHGRGYSRFEHARAGIALDLMQFVPGAESVKISCLRIHNRSNRTRHLTLTAYVEWVLGTLRSATAPFITTEIDSSTGGMLARNVWGGIDGRVAFMDLGGRQTSWTGNRMEFIGRNGTLERPAALVQGATLSGRTGAGFDPCGALQSTIELAAGSSIEIVWLLGVAPNLQEAQASIARWRAEDIDAALQAVRSSWSKVLDTVTVRTPDRAFDLMLNGWLLYQALVCRVWARSAFYQASGAYGFRDQLQDTMALLLAQPGLAREHLLRVAGRQFPAGDVQHWWLPQTGRGVRTRVADDRIWLGHCVAHYVATTADAAVLDERVQFLEGPALQPGEADNFFLPTDSEESATLYEHCARGLDSSLAVGSHGLPLIGSGDWNDGMNEVGAQGRGESVWLGWFLHATLLAFMPLAQARGDHERAERWRENAAALQTALDSHGWDGSWYRRAYFDDGTAMGSAANAECRIDSIAQSWSVLSGAANPDRARQAMESLHRHLVRRGEGLALLLTPPFERSSPDPGYIQAYPPGIRENGGQYTHAAAWAVIAFAQLGDGDKAGELFSLLNPINHALTHDAALRYRVEPYVVAADIYSEPPQVGRGGWTWYTGSAAWMYRAGLEWILGLRITGSRLLLDPCVPCAWKEFHASLRYRDTRYEIAFTNPRGVVRGVVQLQLDGVDLAAPPAIVPLLDDGAIHHIHVVLG